MIKKIFSIILLTGIATISYGQSTLNSPANYFAFLYNVPDVSQYLNITGIPYSDREPFINYTYFSNVILMDYETGDPEVYNNRWKKIVQPGVLANYAISLNQPQMSLAIGGVQEGDARMYVTEVAAELYGSRYIHEIHVGTYINNEPAPYLTIANADTLFIDVLEIAKDAHLVHEGPAPLVIKEEFHNNGTFTTETDNLVLQFNKTDGKHAMLENSGTFVGRAEYEFGDHSLPNVVTNNMVLDYYTLPTLLDTVQLVFGAGNYAYEEELSVMIGQAFVTDDWSAVIDSINSWGENQSTYLGSNFFRFGKLPLKGSRLGITSQDYTRKWIRNLDSTKNYVSEYQTQAEDIHEMLGPYEDLLSGSLDIAINLYSGEVNQAFHDYINGDEIVSYPAIETITYTGDTVLEIVEIYYNAVENGTVVGDTLVYIDTVFYTVPELLVNIQLVDNAMLQGGNSIADVAPNTPEGDWINTLELSEASYGHGWIWHNNTFPSEQLWHDFRTIGPEKNKFWESQDHYLQIDTPATFSIFDGFFPNLITPNVSDYYTGDYNEDAEAYISSLVESANVPDNYPTVEMHNATYVDEYANGQLQAILSGTVMTGIDASTPLPTPATVLWKATGAQQWINPTVYSYKGTPWLNSDEAYALYPYHPQSPNQNLIPNMQMPNTDENGTSIVLPSVPSVSYVYAQDGNLYESGSWQLCTQTESEIYCLNNLFGQDPIQLIGYNSAGNFSDVLSQAYLDSLFTPEEQEEIIQSSLGQSQWGAITNVTGGYLNLDKVAQQYFQDYPNATNLEFRIPALRDWIGNPNYNIFAQSLQPGQHTNWVRRKYFKVFHVGLGQELVASELDYWLTLLHIQYEATGGIGMSDQAITTALAWADGTISPGEENIYLYLMQAEINPYVYTKLSKYVLPGQSMWVFNGDQQQAYIQINNDMAEFDYNLPDLDSNYVFGADQGPWSNLSYGSSGNRTSSEILASSNDDYASWANNVTTLLAWSFTDQGYYFPYVLCTHSFNDGASNEINRSEDGLAQTTLVPFAFQDSSNFGPAKQIVDDGPHNEAPTHLFIPKPSTGGKWEIELISKQTTGTRWYDTDIETYIDPAFNNAEIEVNHVNPEHVRIAVQLYDSLGTIGGYQYLKVGDRLVINDSDYTADEWPLHARMYITNVYADINGDGIVNNIDLTDILTAFGTCETDYENGFPNSNADTNDDGCVTIQDYLNIIGSYGQRIGTGGYGVFSQNSIPVIDGVEANNIEDAFEETAPYTESFVQEGGRLSSFGETVSVYDKQLNLIVTGNNQVVIPTLNANETYLVVGTNSIGHINNNLIVQEAAAYDPGSITYDGTTYTASQGSGLALQLTSMAGASNTDWITFYTNFDFSNADGANEAIPNISPRINQLYYGWNSLNTTGQLMSPFNAKIEGLVDIFSAGAANNIDVFNAGVYANNAWYPATSGYKSYPGSNNRIFKTKNIPFAFVSNNQTTFLNTKPSGLGLNSKFKPVNNGTIGQYFGEHSELTALQDPTSAVWGEKFVEYNDYNLEHGVITSVDMFTLRDYFKLKLIGTSPKFGVSNVADSRPRWPYNHGEQLNYSGAIAPGSQQTPAKAWAPNKCSNYTEWGDNIVTPFIQSHLGLSSNVLTTEASPPMQDNKERNNTAGHYDWFINSALNNMQQSYGPLVYDFNCDGFWTADDIVIWDGITSYWSSLGDDDLLGEYTPASYYRSGTDALNAIINVLPTVETKGEYFEPAKNFDQIFDKNQAPFINPKAANWVNCLDNVSYINNSQAGSSVNDPRFDGSTTLSIFEPVIDPILLTSAAATNSEGYREIVDFVAIPSGYQLHPSDGFFPTTWQN